MLKYIHKKNICWVSVIYTAVARIEELELGALLFSYPLFPIENKNALLSRLTKLFGFG
jgi:hypothetical protein